VREDTGDWLVCEKYVEGNSVIERKRKKARRWEERKGVLMEPNFWWT